MFSFSKKSLVFVTAALFSAGSFAANGQLQTDKRNVDQACAAEAATAGCGNEQVGSGLLKCIRTYKRAHADFKPSQSCGGAMRGLIADGRELREQRESAAN